MGAVTSAALKEYEEPLDGQDMEDKLEVCRHCHVATTFDIRAFFIAVFNVMSIVGLKGGYGGTDANTASSHFFIKAASSFSMSSFFVSSSSTRLSVSE